MSFESGSAAVANLMPDKLFGVDIRLWLLGAAFLAELFVLYQLVHILVEHYRERKKCKRKCNQDPSEPN